MKSELGEEYINGVYPPNTLHASKSVNYIPDSGYAVLQIMLNYFETIQFYKTADNKTNAKNRFTEGVNDVFPEAKGWKISPSLADVLYNDLRSGLYHAIAKNPTGSQIRLLHVDDTTVFTYVGAKQWSIDPHNMIRRLRQHLKEFISELKNPKNVALRDRFEKAFNTKILGKE